MFEIVLFEPEIPPNTGNVIRLCANTGCRLHLVRPLGFSLRDKQLQRAGLDYAELAEIVQHEDWPACRSALAGRRLFAVTTRGARRYHEPQLRRQAMCSCSARKRAGCPRQSSRSSPLEQRIRLPMREASRSLNLSNAVAVVVYEAWRQLGFRGGA